MSPIALAKRIHRDAWVLLGYAAFFLVLFSQFSARGKIPGNCDSWLVISLSNAYWVKVKALLAGATATTAMFPATNVHAYGESSPLCATLFVGFRLLGFDDVMAYYFFITVIFFLNAFAIYKLATLYTGNSPSAIFAGFAFTCSNFMFANIDDSVMFLYFFPALAAFHLKRYIADGRLSSLYLAGLLGGAQIYCSVYGFIFQCIILVAIAALNIRRLVGSDSRRRVFLALAIYVGVALPYAVYLAHILRTMDVVNPFNTMAVITDVGPNISLSFSDFFNVLPNNLFYSSSAIDQAGTIFWVTIRRHAFLGGLLLLLAGLGLFRITRAKIELVAVGLVGLVVAMGARIDSQGIDLHPSQG